ncbi:unnamed protein product [Polarella glacialis]|uniref:Uncharacterized protein n=1 Tax=Polarella glacialis TaxID=89957 RepID=A0A813LH88_POLGL|nr:unnamed protein product [Polarella glacialis]
MKKSAALWPSLLLTVLGQLTVSAKPESAQKAHVDEKSEPVHSWRYGSMIDAGSEGSRIYLFRWKPTLRRSEEIVIPEATDALSTTPGIGSFASYPGLVGASLKPLVDFAMKGLHHVKSNWEHTPIFLRATAGMRLLDPDEREDILEEVRTFLKQTPFRFHESMASVATGEEEGVFGWLTVNAQLGNIRADRLINSKTTVGALDLGGASAQIVFMPQKSILQHAFPMSLGPHRFHVYSWSFLHFGQRESAHRAADIVISEALLRVQSAKILYHPCFSTNYTYSPRFSYSHDNSSFPVTATMQGSSDFDGCLRLIKRTFNKDTPCLVTHCSFYGVYQPRLYDSNFIAFSYFAKAADYLAVPRDAPLSEFLVASEYVCSLSRTQLDIIFARIENHYDRLHMCFHATFIYVLLTYGFGFGPDSSGILFKEDLGNGQAIDWVVGGMIYEINQFLPASKTTEAQGNHVERKACKGFIWDTSLLSSARRALRARSDQVARELQAAQGKDSLGGGGGIPTSVSFGSLQSRLHIEEAAEASLQVAEARLEGELADAKLASLTSGAPVHAKELVETQRRENLSADLARRYSTTLAEELETVRSELSAASVAQLVVLSSSPGNLGDDLVAAGLQRRVGMALATERENLCRLQEERLRRTLTEEDLRSLRARLAGCDDHLPESGPDAFATKNEAKAAYQPKDSVAAAVAAADVHRAPAVAAAELQARLAALRGQLTGSSGSSGSASSYPPSDTGRLRSDGQRSLQNQLQALREQLNAEA